MCACMYMIVHAQYLSPAYMEKWKLEIQVHPHIDKTTKLTSAQKKEENKMH